MNSIESIFYFFYIQFIILVKQKLPKPFVLLLIALLPITNCLNAQQLYNNNTTSSSSFNLPLNTVSRCQWIYSPGVFHNGSVSASSGNINKIYLMMGSVINATATYSNLTIKFSQNLGTASVFPVWNAWTTGMTTCLTATSFTFTGVTANSFYGIQLTTPFYYNPALSLVMEVSVTAGTGNTLNSIGSGSSGVFQLKYGGISASTPTTGIQNLVNLGMDIAPPDLNDAGVISINSPYTVCSGSSSHVGATIQNFGINQISSVNVNWSVNGTLQTPITYTGLLDTLGGSGSDTARVILGTYTFGSTPFNIRAWTSNPNFLTDSFNYNDTSYAINRRVSMPGGIYTIDASQPPSSTNFQTFQAAVDSMNYAGICGPIVFNIATGTFIVGFNFTIPMIDGISAVNTITFEGGAGNAPTRIISANIFSDLCNYVIFDNLTFNYSTSNTSNFILGNVKGCTIKNCIFITTQNNGDGAPVHIVSGDFSGSTIAGAPSTIDSITIDSNTFTGGDMGVVILGNSDSSVNRGIKIRYNKFTDIAGGGIYIRNCYNNIDVLNNSFDMVGAPFQNNYSLGYGWYGIYFLNNINSGNTPSNICNNTITNWLQYGIFCYSPGGSTPANAINIYNNMIIGAKNPTRPYDSAGIYFYNTNNYSRIFHNSILMPQSVSSNQSSGIYASGSAYTSIKNNIIMNTATGGTGVNIYCATAILNDSLNYNNYFNTSNTTLVYNNGTTYNSSTFASSSGGGSSSTNRVVSFKNNLTDLHIFNPCTVPLGLNLTSILPKDMDGVTRPVPPHVGSCEPVYFANDLAIDSLINPTSTFTTGYQNIVIRVRNVGTSTITSGTISYRFNGGSPVSQTFSDTLHPCDTITIAFTIPVNLTSINLIKVYTSNPNGLTDNNHSNDTGIYFFALPLSGIYTINDSLSTGGINFQSFTEAKNALLTFGMAGSVMFNVAAGTYNEQVNLSGTIPGSTYQITFDGGTGNAATRIITFSGDSQATVIFNGINNISFRNFTITNNNYGACSAIGIENTTSGISLSNCILNLPNIGTSYSYGISTGTSLLGYIAGANSISNINIDTCIINNYPTYGVYIEGRSSGAYNSNLKFRGNTITGYNTGIYFFNIFNGIDVMYNTINLTPIVSSYGILYNICNTVARSSGHRICGNKVFGSGSRGISYACFGSSSYPATIINNVVGGDWGSSFINPMGISDNAQVFVYHNTINISANAGSPSGYGLYVQGTTGVYHLVKNNIINIAATFGTVYPLKYVGPTSGNIAYNMYYNGANSTIYTIGSSTTTITTAITTANRATYFPIAGDSSVYALSQFVNPNDYHTIQGCGNRSLINIPMAGADIVGNSRPASPTMGAYEYQGTSNDLALISVVQPQSPITPGTQSIIVKIQNEGTTTITNTTFYCKVNSGSPTSFVWTGTLSPCDTAWATITGVTLISGIDTLKVYSSLPNGNPDGNRSNDTFVTYLGSPLHGTYTINPMLPAAGINYQSFEAAIADVSLKGASGSVMFLVSSGTYTPTGGNLIINNYSSKGVSDTNTITFSSLAGIADSVIVIGSGTGYLLTMNGTADFIFKGITFTQPTGTSAGSIIQFIGSPAHDTIYNCKLIAQTYTSTQTYLVNANGLYLNGIVFRNNVFQAGYYGIYMNNSTSVGQNCIIDSNLFQDNYYSSLYITANSINFKIRYNIFNITVTGHYLNISTPDSAYEFGYNQINSSVAQAYLYINYGAQGNSLSHGKIYNNKVTVASSTMAVNIYCTNGRYQDIYNNDWNMGSGTVYFGGGNAQRYYNNTFTSSNYAASYGGMDSVNEILNNVFVNTAGGSVLYFSYFNPFTSISTTIMDYNNFYTSGANVIARVGSVTYSLAAWKNLAVNFTALRDHNSLSYSPGFTAYSPIANTTLNLSDSSVWSLKGRGKPTSWIATDINGNPRSTSILTGPVCIGAYEFTPNTGVLPPLATAVPSAPVAGSNQYFLFGGDTLASISWTSFLSPPTSIGLRAYPGTLAPTLSTPTSAWQFLDAYWNFTTPAGSYGYNLNLYYKDIWLYNVPSKMVLSGVAKYPTSSWTSNIFSSATNDTTNDILTIPNLSTLTNALYTGTTASTPWTIYNNTITGAQNICPGSTPASLIGSTPTGGDGSYQYTWLKSTTNATSGFTIASGTNSNINYSPSAISTNTWFRRLVISGGITDTSTAIAIITNKNVGFTVNNSAQCFSGNNFIFNDTSIIAMGTLRRLWNFGNGISDTTSSINPNKTYSSSGTFTVKLVVTDNNGCKDSLSKTIGVGLKPNPGFTINNNSQCVNANSFAFVDTSTISSGTLSRVWNFGSSVNDSSTLVNPNKTYSISGTYAVKLISNSNGCKDSVIKTVSVNPKPAVGYSINNAAQCFSGNNFLFGDTSSISSGSIQRVWSFGNGDTSTAINTSKSYTIANTYLVKLISTSNNGCKDSITKTVSVNAKPNAGFTVNNASQCVNENNFIFNDTSTLSSGTLSRNWNFGNGVIDTAINPNKTYLTSGIFTVKLVANNNGCKDSVSKNITVNPKPIVGYTINNLPTGQAGSAQCINGNNFSFTDTSTITSGTINRLWNLGNGDTSTSINTTKSYNNSNTYSVKLVEISNNGCKDSITKTVIVNPKPIVNFTINNLPTGQAGSTQCLIGNNFLFRDSSIISSGMLQRSWSFGNGDTSTILNPSKTYSSANSYSVKLVSISNFGCKDSITKTVNVYDKPSTGFTINNSSQCVNGNVFIFNDTSTINFGTLTRLWNFEPADTSSSINPNKTYTTSGTYAVKLIASNNGCKDSLTKTITVNPKPIVGFIINNTSQCFLTNNFFFADTTSGINTRIWNLGDLSTNTNDTFSKSYSVIGLYNVSLKIVDTNNCTDSITKVVTVKPSPAKPVVSEITKSLLQSTSANSYQWYQNGNMLTGAINQTLTLTSNGSYVVLIDSTNGCSNLSNPFAASAVGIAGINISDNEIKIYPNPATNELFINISSLQNSTEVVVEIFDLKGSKVMSFNESFSNIIKINLSSLEAGLYFIIINNRAYKFIKSDSEI